MKLFDYQVEGVKFLQSRDRCILADLPGMGKTAQALMAIGDRAIIIVPSGLKYTWKTQCKLWRPDLKPFVMEGRDMLRFPGPGEVTITNLEILPEWLLAPPTRCEFKPKDKSPKAKKRRKELAAARKEHKRVLTLNAPYLEYTTLILDEAHKVKNPKSKRSNKFKWLAAMCPRIWFLTGTPMKKGSPENLWYMLEAGHMSKIIFKNLPNFKNVMNMNVDEVYGTISYGTPSKEAHKLLSKYMLRRQREDVLKELPPKLYEWIEVPIESEENDHLDKLQKKFYKNIIEKDFLPPFNHFAKSRSLIARSRTKHLLNLIEEDEEQGIRGIVFSCHRYPVEELGKREGWALITGDTPSSERERIEQEQEKYKGIAISMQAGNVGRTFTSFNYVTFVDLDWDLNENEQAEDRVFRIGQEKTVYIRRFTSGHPLDKLINNKLVTAGKMQDIIIDGK